VLKESALVEAFNLKAAIEYNMKNYEAAREAMADAPPRTEEELDPVSALDMRGQSLRLDHTIDILQATYHVHLLIMYLGPKPMCSQLCCPDLLLCARA